MRNGHFCIGSMSRMVVSFCFNEFPFLLLQIPFFLPSWFPSFGRTRLATLFLCIYIMYDLGCSRFHHSNTNDYKFTNQRYRTMICFLVFSSSQERGLTASWIMGDTHHHQGDSACCAQPSPTPSLTQTLDELDWERGIWNAALSGDLAGVHKLLSSGCDVNTVDKSGYTALVSLISTHWKVLVLKRSCNGGGLGVWTRTEQT